MRTGLVGILLVTAWFCSCEHPASVRREPSEDDLGRSGPFSVSDEQLDGFDLVQRTCALYVAIRSGALEDPVAFGRDMEDIAVHWNFCPGGTMVACVTVPNANGDSTLTGLPWPY